MEKLICVVEQGKLEGLKEKGIHGKPFLSFMKIPYAKPPLGGLRFKAPQPPLKWDGVKDATEQGVPCYSQQLLPSAAGLKREIKGSEDCLHLNVFTNKLRENEQQILCPVMVFIHGGAFVTGFYDRHTAGPEYLMTEDVVLVTITYRLGALGFLVVDDPSLESTGNTGLKDMVEALKWVQKNIKQFNGDPNNVTIFGESAGGAAVHYLVLSPSAKGLFHKAIMQSGTVLCPWARGINDARRLAEALGCAETENTKILEFLQNVPVEKILEAQLGFGDRLTPEEKRNFSPNVETITENVFLCENPLELMSSGNYNHVPMMFGYNSLEGVLFDWDNSLDCANNLEEYYVPFYFGYLKGSELYNDLKTKICKFYFGSEKTDLSNKKAVCDVFTDTVFLRGIYRSMKLHAKTCENSVYFYRMSLETELNLFKKMVKTRVKGASHVDDIAYLFKMSDHDLKIGTIEELSVRRFVKMWTNFARTGNPIPVSDPVVLNTEWKPVTENEVNFLDIDTDLRAGTDPDAERIKFWDDVEEGLEEVF